jgi:multidrug efflux pump subunit AcrB
MTKFSPFSTLVIFFAISLVGLGMVQLLNVQLNPSRSLSSVSVNFSWPGNEAGYAKNVSQPIIQ